MDGTASLIYLISGYAVEGDSVAALASDAPAPSKARSSTRKMRRRN